MGRRSIGACLGKPRNRGLARLCYATSPLSKILRSPDFQRQQSRAATFGGKSGKLRLVYASRTARSPSLKLLRSLDFQGGQRHASRFGAKRREIDRKSTR